MNRCGRHGEENAEDEDSSQADRAKFRYRPIFSHVPRLRFLLPKKSPAESWKPKVSSNCEPAFAKSAAVGSTSGILSLVTKPLLMPVRPHAFATLMFGDFGFAAFFDGTHREKWSGTL